MKQDSQDVQRGFRAKIRIPTDYVDIISVCRLKKDSAIQIEYVSIYVQEMLGLSTALKSGTDFLM